jgi:hypothetical protein
MTKRLKRPRDPIQLGKLIVDIATGQVVEEPETTTATKAGKSGGPARALALTPEQRSEIARAALHVLAGRLRHDGPKRILNTATGDAYRVIDAMAAPLIVGGVFLAESGRHIPG